MTGVKAFEGKDVSESVIRQWVEVVNEEFGLSDKNEESVAFFMAIKNMSIFLLAPDMYAVLMPTADMWGNKEMYVVSFYIRKECRKFKAFIELQKDIEAVARAYGAEALIEGSHLDKRLFKFLQHGGYEVATMKKEL